MRIVWIVIGALVLMGMSITAEAAERKCYVGGVIVNDHYYTDGFVVCCEDPNYVTTCHEGGYHVTGT